MKHIVLLLIILVAGEDYEAISSLLTLDFSSRNKSCVDIVITDDNSPESEEIFSLQLNYYH